ncbi:MAG: hypothetical protein COC20_07330 [Cellvibrionales bacterium]|nr:MAG: hypothetical protein COC20_07330 [Cellvibrionales bacterium]
MRCKVGQARWQELRSDRIWGRQDMTKTKKRIEGHQLYYFNACPFCIKVRLALWWLGLKIPLKNIKTQSSNKVDLIDGGGTQQVPCLRIESEAGDIRWLYESSDIIRYIKAELCA